MRSRARSRVEEVRSRVQAKRGTVLGHEGVTGVRPQMKMGGGQLIQQVRQRADQVTARIQERKSGLIPKVQEFKPGERIRKVLTPQTTGYNPEIVSHAGLSVEGEEFKLRLADQRGLSVII